jgi:hypothetical protein
MVDYSRSGIYNQWRGEAGEVIDSYAILTTRPNNVMSVIHDRMPVIFANEDRENVPEHLAVRMGTLEDLPSCIGSF